MAEYIERDAAIKYLEIHKKEAKKNNFVLCANEDSIIKFLREKCPTADVVEVVHGRWIRHKENCLYNKCSICCYEHCRENNYCPNCGADMRGDEK